MKNIKDDAINEMISEHMDETINECLNIAENESDAKGEDDSDKQKMSLKEREEDAFEKDREEKTAVFLDLDGTFWNREKVPESAMTAIERAKNNGHLIFVNTGRTADNIPDFLWNMNLDGYLLATGMDLYRDGHNFRRYFMDENTVRDIEDYLKQHHSGYSLQEAEVSYDDPKFAFRRTVFFNKEGRREWMNRVHLDGMEDHPRNRIMKVNFDNETPFDLIPLMKRDGLDVLFYVNKHNPLNGFGSAFRGELTDASHNKALAMHEILEGIPGCFRLLAIGDSENDIPMFEAADIAVCMGNGTEEAKAKADWVTDRIDNDGLYKAFDHFELI